MELRAFLYSQKRLARQCQSAASGSAGTTEWASESDLPEHGEYATGAGICGSRNSAGRFGAHGPPREQLVHCHRRSIELDSYPRTVREEMYCARCVARATAGTVAAGHCAVHLLGRVTLPCARGAHHPPASMVGIKYKTRVFFARAACRPRALAVWASRRSTAGQCPTPTR